MTENWRKQIDIHKIEGALLINMFIRDIFLFIKNAEALSFADQNIRW